MKKICALIIMILLVTGCGGNELNNLDVNKASDAIEKSLKGMVEIEGDTLQDVYDLDLSVVESHIVKQNSYGDLYAIIKTNDKVTVKEDMEGYFEKIKEFNEVYAPERLETLASRVEKEIGDYLIYIVAEDANDIYQDVINTME